MKFGGAHLSFEGAEFKVVRVHQVKGAATLSEVFASLINVGALSNGHSFTDVNHQNLLILRGVLKVQTGTHTHFD